jgi:hypothetical protein
MAAENLMASAYRKEWAMGQPHPDSALRKALIVVMVLLAVTHSAARAELQSTKVCSPAMDQAHLTAEVLSALVVKSVLVERAAWVKTTALVSVTPVANQAAVPARHTRRP